MDKLQQQESRMHRRGPPISVRKVDITSVNYTPNEAKLMKAMKRYPKRKWSVDALATQMYAGSEKQRPKFWRATTMQTLRTLQLKVQLDGMQLNRVTPLGRGNVARYQLRLPN